MFNLKNIDFMHPSSFTVKVYYKDNWKFMRKVLSDMMYRASRKSKHKALLKKAVDQYIVPAARRNIEIQMQRYPNSAKWGRTGELYRSVHSEYLGGRSIFGISVPTNTAAVLVGTPLAYGRFIEFGIPQRRARRSKVMVFKDILGNVYFRETVKGAPPRPWLIPAVYSNIQNVTNEAGSRVSTFIVHGNKAELTSAIKNYAYMQLATSESNTNLYSVEVEI